MKPLFVTATGTEIGKSFVTAALAWQLRQRNKNILALKPVLSGLADTSIGESDTGLLASAQGLPHTDATWDMLTPFRYLAPLAPSMAAALEGRTLDTEALIRFCRDSMAAHAGPLLIEGVGGAFVPLDDRMLVADWIKALDADCLLVAGSYLGTISHTLATFEALQNRGIRVRALLVSESEKSGNTPHPDLGATCDTLALHTGLETIALPRLTGMDAFKLAPDLTHLILSAG